MTKNYLRNGVLIGLLFYANTLSAQNEFYISGDNNSATTEVYVDGKDGVNPTLYVQGEMVNNQGVFQNINGEIELTGNFTNTANGTNAYYESTGIERFSGNANSLISGNLNGTSGNTNQLYDLKINKAIAVNYVNLANDVHVNNTIEFEGNGIISTNGNTHNDDGSTYTNLIYVRNNSLTAITGHSVASGATNKYIEGKLKRDINLGKYYFPIGVQPSSIDGMEAMELDAKTAFGTAVLAYVKKETTNPNITIYDDLGEHPTTGGAGLDFSHAVGACGSNIDGILDRVVATEGQSHAWVVTPDAGTTFSYDIEFFPGANLVASANFYYCGAIKLQYLAKDGVPNGDGTSTGQGLPTFTATGYLTDPNATNKLTGQTSFSTFRNVGAILTQTTLPVELLSIKAYGVENEYINVDWATATEINNQKFEVQRSIDGENFSPIGVVAGAGNSQSQQNYTFADYKVAQNVNYYYRLKQIDYDGSYHYTDIVNAKIKGIETMGGFTLYPNPAKENQAINLTIISNIRTNAQVEVFSLIGKHLHSEQMALNEGTNHYQLQAQLLQGHYIVVVKTTQKEFKQKIIITK